MPFAVVKADETQHIVFGWGSVSLVEKGLITDLQGDQIEPDVLERAVYDFMLESRQSGVMHEGKPVGDVIVSLVTTPDIVKAFGLGDVPVGWILGVKVHDAAVWDQVVKGELRAFSIQGTADREKVDGDSPA